MLVPMIPRFPRFFRSLITLLSVVLLSSACATGIQYTSNEHRKFAVTSEDLENYGIAFITPSSITGREQDRQSLALTFAEVLRETRPEIPVVTLPETLGAVNRAGLLPEYKTMFEDYADTGIFDHETLKKIAAATGVRYLAELKLAGFTQDSTGRFGVMGLRLLETKRANLRVFFQLWDSQTGTIVWEGYEEMDFAYDTYSERSVTFHDIATAMARQMFAKLPNHHPARPAPEPDARPPSDDFLD